MMRVSSVPSLSLAAALFGLTVPLAAAQTLSAAAKAIPRIDDPLVAARSVLAPTARPPVRGRPVVPPPGTAATPGAYYLETLPLSAREPLKRTGQAILEETASGAGPAEVRAVVRFDRPKHEVYALLSQPSTQYTFLPNVKESKTVGERTEHGESNDFLVSVVVSFRYRTQHWFYPELSRVEWFLDPAGGGSLAEQSGYWQLYELDDASTIAEYGTRVVARHAVFDFFRGLGERGAIVEALTAVRRHVDSQSRSAPEKGRAK